MYAVNSIRVQLLAACFRCLYKAHTDFKQTDRESLLALADVIRLDAIALVGIGERSSGNLAFLLIFAFKKFNFIRVH